MPETRRCHSCGADTIETSRGWFCPEGCRISPGMLKVHKKVVKARSDGLSPILAPLKVKRLKRRWKQKKSLDGQQELF